MASIFVGSSKTIIMTKIILSAALALLFCACQSPAESENSSIHTTSATMDHTAAKSAIETLLFAYRDALNAADVPKILALYTQDGVFMPTGAPTSQGQEQVKGAYEFVFSNIRLNIEFFVDEIVVNGDYAFARTISRGTTLIHATGETVAEENRELFVLKQEQGSWKIARYMFNKMK